MSGTVGPRIPPFQNTYSLDFDGVNDYVDCGVPSNINSLPNLSISCWFKTTTTTATYIVGSDSQSSGRRFLLGTLNSSGIKIRFLYFTNPATASFNTILSTTNVNDGLWHHLLVVNNGTNMFLYLDGILENSNTDGGINAAQPNTPLNIGRRSYLGSYGNFDGNIDEVAIWGTDQSSNIATLSTSPTVDLTSLNPIAWYRMGDNGAYKDPQWLIPNNENKDKVSNYSMKFDGLDDRVDVGTGLNLGINSTVSFWIKRNRVGVGEVVLGEDSYAFDYLLYLNIDNSIFFRIDTIFLQFKRIDGAIRTIMNQTTSWVNVVVVRTGDSAELFLNGNSMQTISGFGVSVDTRFDIIGSKPDGSFATNALIDEVSAWNTNTINPSDIYNGGNPPNLVTLNPTSYWKMGENATYVENVNPDGTWTIPDEVGTNDGTSNNVMADSARVGESPNATNNALSFNMDLIDRVPDTPSTP